MAKYLVVDDEMNIQKKIRATLEEMGYEVNTASNGQEALVMLLAQKADFWGMFTDLRMPGMDGLALLRALAEERKSLPTIMVSAVRDIEPVVEAFQLGILTFISKPFSPDEIKSAVELMNQNRIDLKETSNLVKGLIEQSAFPDADSFISKLFQRFPSSPIPHFLMALSLEARQNKASLLQGQRNAEELPLLDAAKKHLKAALALDEGYEPASRKLREWEERS
ncbi:MAG TPA: response regulator [Thermotogota bacterium]|nr:response regulator [Thermotogota bacterium]HRW91699.1 response regulator [Thermotogota bacterium]